jgi:hypothetical protein
MSEQQDKRWLDEQLRQVVNGTTPRFEAESWKQRYAKEYQMLLTRGRQASPSSGTPGRIVPLLRKGSFTKLAVAAALLAVAGVLLLGRLGPNSHQPPTEPPSVAESPARMMTMMSLQAAYRQGGTEALNRQCDNALKMLGPRTTSISLKELLEG